MEDEELHYYPKGVETKKILNSKGIESPKLNNMVRINDKTWMEAPNHLNDVELQAWIDDKRKLIKTII